MNGKETLCRAVAYNRRAQNPLRRREDLRSRGTDGSLITELRFGLRNHPTNSVSRPTERCLKARILDRQLPHGDKQARNRGMVVSPHQPIDLSAAAYSLMSDSKSVARQTLSWETNVRPPAECDYPTRRQRGSAPPRGLSLDVDRPPSGTGIAPRPGATCRTRTKGHPRESRPLV